MLSNCPLKDIYMMHARSPYSCPTLCNPMDYSPPGSSVHGILHAGILEWVAFPPPGDLPHPVIRHVSLMSPALAGMCIYIYILVLSQQGNPITLQY